MRCILIRGCQERLAVLRSGDERNGRFRRPARILESLSGCRVLATRDRVAHLLRSSRKLIGGPTEPTNGYSRMKNGRDTNRLSTLRILFDPQAESSTAPDAATRPLINAATRLSVRIRAERPQPDRKWSCDEGNHCSFHSQARQLVEALCLGWSADPRYYGIGRATVNVLVTNDSRRLELRRQMLEGGVWP